MTDRVKINMINKYNGIVNSIGYEHVSIGTPFSEHTDDWNARDLICEADYILSTYYESGHSNCDLKEDDPGMWRKEVKMLKHFISYYEPKCQDIIANTRHCSQYDPARRA